VSANLISCRQLTPLAIAHHGAQPPLSVGTQPGAHPRQRLEVVGLYSPFAPEAREYFTIQGCAAYYDEYLSRFERARGRLEFI